MTDTHFTPYQLEQARALLLRVNARDPDGSREDTERIIHNVINQAIYGYYMQSVVADQSHTIFQLLQQGAYNHE